MWNIFPLRSLRLCGFCYCFSLRPLRLCGESTYFGFIPNLRNRSYIVGRLIPAGTGLAFHEDRRRKRDLDMVDLGEPPLVVEVPEDDQAEDVAESSTD